MIEIVPFSPHRQDEVVSVILTIQRDEFGIPVTLADQPDLLDIPGFYQRGLGNFSTLPATFPIMAVDTKFYVREP